MAKGKITYHRTDSLSLNIQAIDQIRKNSQTMAKQHDYSIVVKNLINELEKRL